MPDYRKKFSKTYDKYVEKIYRFIFLKVDSQETAEDLTSQVFSKAWAKIQGLSAKTNGTNKEIENLPAYIYQIARAEVANFHRHRAKYRIISVDSGQMPDPSANLEENRQKEQEIENLRISLAKLDSDCQNIVIWHYLDGMPYRDIGEVMGKSEGAIRVMAHRALKELKEKIS